MDSPEPPASPAPRKRAKRPPARANKQIYPAARSAPALEGGKTANESDSPPVATDGEAEELRAPDGTPMRVQPHGGALWTGGSPGRPTTYDPAYCDMVPGLGQKGFTVAMIARELGTPLSTLREWRERHPDFRSALSHARDLALAWMEQQGLEGLWIDAEGRKLNERQWSRMMAAMWPDEWSERLELRATVARIELGRLDDDQIRRISAGEHPLAVLASSIRGTLAGTVDDPHGPAIEADFEVLDDEG